MIPANREVISVLHDLIETCKDSEEGFRHAAQHVQSSLRSALFETYSRQAARFAAELEGELRRLGGNPEETDVYSRFASPGWVTITGKRTEEDETAILAECECGVDAADQSYATALEKRLPEEVRLVIERQQAELKQISARIHNWAGHHRFGVRPPHPEREVPLSSAREPSDRPPAAGARTAGKVRREPGVPAHSAPPG